MRRRTRHWLLGGTLALAAMGGLSWQLLRETQTAAIATAPPRAAPSPLPPPPPSSIALPVRVPLALLEAAVNDAVPQQLWQVDKPGSVCLKAGRVRMFGAKLKLTPDVKCRIVGDVIRGPIRLSSRDNKLHLAMPVAATLEARDIGGLSMGKGAEAKALITADLVPELTRDGRLTARIQLRYDWRQEPTVSILGQQIRLTEKADEKLAPMLAKMEAELPRRLATLPVRSELEKLWRQGFTVQSINRRNPAAWLRLTPQALAVDGMKVERRDLRIDARLGALAEVVLGQQPAAPVATPLQAIGKTGGPPGLLLHSAVLADPATLQRPIDKALAKVAARGVLVPEWGRVKVRFGPSTLYATEGGKLALGLQIRARGPRQLLDTRGRLWLTARPETQPDSERMLVRDLALAAQPGDDVQLPLLVAVAQSAEVKAALEDALTQDFTRDYTKLLGKIDRALAEVKTGEFRLAMRLDEVHHGKAVVLGQGIYLPVTATGSARLDYAPMLQPRPR
jgi:hypothetical protein